MSHVSNRPYMLACGSVKATLTRPYWPGHREARLLKCPQAASICRTASALARPPDPLAGVGPPGPMPGGHSYDRSSCWPAASLWMNSGCQECARWDWLAALTGSWGPACCVGGQSRSHTGNSTSIGQRSTCSCASEAPECPWGSEDQVHRCVPRCACITCPLTCVLSAHIYTCAHVGAQSGCQSVVTGLALYHQEEAAWGLQSPAWQVPSGQPSPAPAVSVSGWVPGACAVPWLLVPPLQTGENDLPFSAL